MVTRKDIFLKVDLIHFPYFDLFFHTLPIIKKKKTVVTIHDCIPLIFPKYYPSGIKGNFSFLLQKIALGSVNMVLTDSDSSKKDIKTMLNCPESKIKTVYLAPDEKYQKLIIGNEIKEELSKKFGLQGDFILYAGDANYNKNIESLIKAFARIDKKYQLVLVGKAWENNQLPEVQKAKEIVKNESLDDRVRFVGFLDDRELVQLYNLAKVYCQPSFYEGFGLQILEAMACGCPVVTSNLSSMPEVAGAAAVLVNPYRIEDIAEGINRLITDESFRKDKINLGYTQTKKFSWVKTAEETIKYYEKVVSE